jgi:hypothetical protein
VFLKSNIICSEIYKMNIKGFYKKVPYFLCILANINGDMIVNFEGKKIEQRMEKLFNIG